MRVAQLILAMAAAIWHNNNSGAPITRSLISYHSAVVAWEPAWLSWLVGRAGMCRLRG